jgi:hypothetical protein
MKPSRKHHLNFTPKQRWLIALARKEKNPYEQAELIYQALDPLPAPKRERS